MVNSLCQKEKSEEEREEKEMIGQALDFYSFYHVIGGFALGVFLGAFINRRYALQLAVILPTIWEVIECNILSLIHI